MFQNHILNFGRTDKPKAIRPFNFPKVGGIKNQIAKSVADVYITTLVLHRIQNDTITCIF